MKKKLLFLMTLLLTVCSGAWADETLFSASVNQSSWTQTSHEKFSSTSTDWTTCANVTLTGTGAAMSSTTDSNQYYQRSPNSTSPTGYWFSLTGNQVVYKIAFTTALQAGDEISMQLKGNNSSASDIGVCFQSTETISRPGTLSSYFFKASLGKGAETVTYTVLPTDATLIGATALYLYRYNTTGTYFNNLTITRPTTYSVSAVTSTGTDTYGTVEAGTTVLQEGATTTITATPATGYKVTNWAVSGTGASIDPEGDSNSLTTTLTMGTAAATVTCTFAAAETYTISYNAGSAEGVTGSRDSETKTESVPFTLPSTAVFTRTGYIQTGWNTNADGTSGTSYALGGSYTTNAAQTFYPEWTAVDYSFVSNGTVNASIDNGKEVTTSTGGKMVATLSGIGTSGTTLIYKTCTVDAINYNCVQFGSSGSCGVTVTLDKQMQAGTKIDITWYSQSGASTTRGFYLGTSNGTDVDTETFATSTADAINKASYTVQAGDGLEGTNSFTIKRYNSVYLISVIITNCADVYAITPANAKSTYVTPAALDFSDVEGLKAYVATAATGGKVTLTEVGAVPASTPLMLIGTATTTYYVPVAGSASAPAVNMFKAGDGTTEFDGSTYDYILYTDGLFYQIGSGTVATKKAYLHCTTDPTGAGAPSLTIDIDGISTGINAVQGAEFKANGEYYNLAGQRVAQPTKGLYIVNGKKVIIK